MSMSLRECGTFLAFALALKACALHGTIPDPSPTGPSCKIGLVPYNVKDESLWFCPKCARNVFFSPSR